MPIISVEMMKTTDEREMQKTVKKNKQREKGAWGKEQITTYHKSTYTGLLLDFKSFTSFSYKLSLIKCLIDRSFKICNNCNSFHNDIENIKSNLIKNANIHHS